MLLRRHLRCIWAKMQPLRRGSGLAPPPPPAANASACDSVSGMVEPPRCVARSPCQTTRSFTPGAMMWRTELSIAPSPVPRLRLASSSATRSSTGATRQLSRWNTAARWRRTNGGSAARRGKRSSSSALSTSLCGCSFSVTSSAARAGSSSSPKRSNPADTRSFRTVASDASMSCVHSACASVAWRSSSGVARAAAPAISSLRTEVASTPLGPCLKFGDTIMRQPQCRYEASEAGAKLRNVYSSVSPVMMTASVQATSPTPLARAGPVT